MVLVNARDAKHVPGRKTDATDAQWLQRLHEYGLLRASLDPERKIAALRDYLRQRERLLDHAASHIRHMQKALMQMNLQLHHVVSDITGATGMRIIRAVLDGERDPAVLAAMRDQRIKASEETIRQALVGNDREEHVFALLQAVELYDVYQAKVAARARLCFQGSWPRTRSCHNFAIFKANAYVSSTIAAAMMPQTGGAAMAVTLTTLVHFNLTNGAHPTDNLLIDAAGDLFGTTNNGGSGDGTAFEIVKTGGAYASMPFTLVNFNGLSGKEPFAGLVADAAGNLFGTTTAGGASGDGTVFEIVKTASGYAGAAITLASFSGLNGINPQAELIVDAAGNLFGTTTGGGASGKGTVFEIAKTVGAYASTPTTLVSFSGPDGFIPFSGLLADAAGNLFGTTAAGGSSFDGTVFEIIKTGSGYASASTVLVNFNVANGLEPHAGLVADRAGNLFGTTVDGGTSNKGTVFEIVKTVAGYASTPTTLVSFNGADGDFPFGGVIVDAAGNLFGTTNQGGASGDGTVFKISKTGGVYSSTPTTLVSFNGANGMTPFASLSADPAGNLFGTTLAGGASNFGTAFEITGSGFVPSVPPTGFIFTPDTAELKALERAGAGLTGNTPLGTFTETGGTAGDSYTFTLGGLNANAFAMSPASNAGTLVTDGGGDLGVRNGKLYALTIQVKDTTNGLNSGSLPFDVVIGRGARDIINLTRGAHNFGIVPTTPTFIYGLGGNDVIDAGGMAGPIWMAGGRGADRMTGGSGPNTYVYGATVESRPATFDVITNFSVARDKIDLTGLGPTVLSFLPARLVGPGPIASHTITWQNSGGNTFIYVNTSSALETIGSANMKIELQGNMTLLAGDFLHH